MCKFLAIALKWFSDCMALKAGHRLGLATVAFVCAKRSDCPCRILAVKAIQVSNLLFAFCRFRNKNLYCQKSGLIQAKDQSPIRIRTRIPVRSRCVSLPLWALRIIRLAYPLVVCLCAINLLTKEGFAGSCRWRCSSAWGRRVYIYI